MRGRVYFFLFLSIGVITLSTRFLAGSQSWLRPAQARALAATTPNSSTTTSSFPASVMIINQVRGSECCDPGTATTLKQQLTWLNQLNLPAFFTVRFDALIDPAFQAVINSPVGRRPGITWGVLLEITPQLAQAAKVPYHGQPETWYEAQSVFPIGYSPVERRQLIDTLIKQYRTVFGTTPSVSTGWIVDTPTLNYLKDTYGVQIHQLTREQWGVDSYTLDGGPPHYPYPASRSWAFMPDFEQDNPLVIVRQTVTDPLANYGDTTSTFTSQPNDYGRALSPANKHPTNSAQPNQPAAATPTAPKTLAYFQALLTQALRSTPTPGWAVIGLENSMEQSWQSEFHRQLQWLATQCISPHCQFVANPTQLKPWLSTTITHYCGLDLAAPNSANDPTGNQPNNQPSQTLPTPLSLSSAFACWITTPHYRVRLRRTADSLSITDLRIYDSQLLDPYTTVTAYKHGFWVAPPLINSALWHTAPNQEPWWRGWFGPPLVPDLTAQPQPDQTATTYVQLPAPNSNQTQTQDATETTTNSPSFATTPDGSLQLQYLDTNSISRRITFAPNTITISPAQTQDVTPHLATPGLLPLQLGLKKNSFSLNWPASYQAGKPLSPGATPVFSLQQLCDSSCSWSFQVDPTKFIEAQANSYPFLLPEPKPRPLSATKTVIYAHNQYALAGRNPVRLVLFPTDELGFPTSLAQPPQVKLTPSVVYSLHNQTFIDVAHHSPQKVEVELALSPQVTKKISVYFAPNCKQTWQTCLLHPRWAWWYLRAILADKFRLLVLKESQ